MVSESKFVFCLCLCLFYLIQCIHDKIDSLCLKYLSVPFLRNKMTSTSATFLPHSFERRVEFPTRVAEFEKKYAALLPPPPPFPPQLVRQSARDMTHDVPRDLLQDKKYKTQGYKNHIHLTASFRGTQVEYKVVLRLDDCDGLYIQEKESRIFNTGEEAAQFMDDLCYIKTLLPQTAREKFISHGK